MKNRLLFLTLFLFLSITIIAQPQWISFTKTIPQTPVFSLLTSTNQLVKFDVEICGMYNENKTENNIVYNRLTIPGAYPNDTIGSPELPVIKYMVAIPECSNVQISYTTVSQKKFR